MGLSVLFIVSPYFLAGDPNIIKAHKATDEWRSIRLRWRSPITPSSSLLQLKYQHPGYNRTIIERAFKRWKEGGRLPRSLLTWTAQQWSFRKLIPLTKGWGRWCLTEQKICAALVSALSQTRSNGNYATVTALFQSVVSVRRKRRQVFCIHPYGNRWAALQFPPSLNPVVSARLRGNQSSVACPVKTGCSPFPCWDTVG